MKLSKAIEMVEEWLEHTTYRFEITYVELKAEGEYQIGVTEYDPCPLDEPDDYFLTVENNSIINNNGDDVIDVAQEAYSNDEEEIEWLMEFDKKWRT